MSHRSKAAAAVILGLALCVPSVAQTPPPPPGQAPTPPAGQPAPSPGAEPAPVPGAQPAPPSGAQPAPPPGPPSPLPAPGAPPVPPPGATPPAPPPPEVQTSIRDRIRTLNVQPAIDVTFSIDIGVAVPNTVVLHPLPTQVVTLYPAYAGYLFFILADGRIVIVHPSSLAIVAVIIV